ncbi:MAG: diacylglycerol kinase family protein [Patescibacteria group bacterium]
MSKLIKSFGWAMHGVRTVWSEEVNFRIELFVGLVVVVLGFYFKLGLIEWVIVVECITAVLSAEMVNTAIEDLCNKVQPNTDPVIGKIKDTMGGFVFIVALGAAIVGILIFSKYF